jgi:hypothetical protein
LMERTLSSRYGRHIHYCQKHDNANTHQLSLQTAPVLLFFPPTVGPNAKVDAQPVRFDFSSG